MNKTIVLNRKAHHEYHLGETYEAGIVLRGTEVKSIRAGKINIADGWVGISETQEAILHQAHISPYTHGNIYNHSETRPRKLLLKKKEIEQLAVEISTKGKTIVPIKIFIKGSWVKIIIAVARGKKDYDKRDSSKEKDAKREMARAMKHKGKI